MEEKLKKEKDRAEKYKRKYKKEEKNKNEKSEQTKGMLTSNLDCIYIVIKKVMMIIVVTSY